METHHCVKMGWPDYDQGFVIPKEEEYNHQDFLAFPLFDCYHHFSSWEHNLQPDLGYSSPVSCLNMFLDEPIFTSPLSPEGLFVDDDRFWVKNEIIESSAVQNQQQQQHQATTKADDLQDSKTPKIDEDDDIGAISSSRNLSRKKISECFSMTIMQAAKELNVGVTLLKKRCREVGIRRWPHRKIKSLQTLINNVQKMDEDEEGGLKRAKAIEILEREKKLMEENPDIELEDQTKRLRQACFKANYKKRRMNNISGVNVSFEPCSSSNSNVLASCVDEHNAVCGSSSEDVKIIKNHDEEEEFLNSFLIDYFSSDCIHLV